MKRFLGALFAALCLSTPAYAQISKPLSSATCASAADTGCLIVNVGGQGTLGFDITGTWVGTISFTYAVGSTYYTWNVTPNGSTSTVSSATANGAWSGTVAGARTVKIYFSAYTSGTATVNVALAQARASSGGGGATLSVNTFTGNQTISKANACFILDDTGGTTYWISPMSSSALKIGQGSVCGTNTIFAFADDGGSSSITPAHELRISQSNVSIAGNTKMSSSLDGILSLVNNAGNDFDRLVLGPANSSGVGVTKSGSGLKITLGDGSTLAPLSASALSVGANLLCNTTPPTISAGFGGATGRSILATNSCAFKIIAGNNATDNTGTITLPAATNGWACGGYNVTAGQQIQIPKAMSTTSVQFNNYDAGNGAAVAYINGDVLTFTCCAF